MFVFKNTLGSDDGSGQSVGSDNEPPSNAYCGTTSLSAFSSTSAESSIALLIISDEVSCISTSAGLSSSCKRCICC